MIKTVDIHSLSIWFYCRLLKCFLAFGWPNLAHTLLELMHASSTNETLDEHVRTSGCLSDRMSSLQGCLIRSKTDLSLAWLDTRVELSAQGNIANRIPPSIQRWGGEVVVSATCFARRAMKLWRLPCALHRGCGAPEFENRIGQIRSGVRRGDESEAQAARITASTSNPANSKSPASRLDLNSRRHSAGSPI